MESRVQHEHNVAIVFGANKIKVLINNEQKIKSILFIYSNITKSEWAFANCKYLTSSDPKGSTRVLSEDLG